MPKNKYLLIILLFLSACSSTSDIVKVSESESYFKDAVYKGRNFYKIDKEISGEKYRIFHQASSGFSGTSGIRSSAEKRANDFCNKKNKEMLKISEHTAKPPYVLGNFPRIEIIFVCENENKKKYENLNNKKYSKYDELKKIKDLLNEGILTKEEYIMEKRKILSKSN